MTTESVGGSPPRLSFIGAGRAGSTLAAAARAAGWDVVAIASSRRQSAGRLADAVGAAVARTPGEAARAADLTFVTVPDPHIAAVAARIAASGMGLRGRGVVHCSASLGPEPLAAVRQAGARTGVAHPLQALCGAGSVPLLQGAYFRIEAGLELRPVLEHFVVAVGGKPLTVATASRALYHAAAVLAGNAPLALLARATHLLEEAGIDAATANAALSRLLEGAAANAGLAGPQRALTGPVARGDAATVQAHLDALATEPGILDLYLRLAEETLALAGIAGREDVKAVLDRAELITRRGFGSSRVA